MKTNLTITALLLCLLAIASAQSAFAQTAKVGVSAGNTFIYDYTLTWESTDPSATMPNEYVNLQNINSIKLNVVSVEGTLINVDSIKQFKDGTESSQNGNIDVNLQILEVPYSAMIIRADANPGEKVYPLGGRTTLDETESKTYSVGKIDTIRYISEITPQDEIQKTEIFYDRANGVGLEYNLETTQTSGSYVTTTKETLLINSWVISQPSSTPNLMLLLIVIPIIVIVIVLLVVYLKRRGHTEANEQEEYQQME